MREAKTEKQILTELSSRRDEFHVDLQKYIKQLQSDLDKLRWIPVSERPKLDIEVWLCNINFCTNKLEHGHLIKSTSLPSGLERIEWFIEYGKIHHLSCYTHWMPILKVPKKECEICKGSGEYREEQDGGSAVLFCDCPAGKQKLQEFEEKNPDCKPHQKGNNE